MGFLFSDDLKTLNDLFVHNLKAIYYAEGQITDALPTMIDKATNPQLKSGFQQHLTETEQQRTRLEQIFGMMEIEAEEGSCPAIDGIITDNDRMAGNIEDASAMDAALAFGAQCVEHHEIAVYGTLVAWAKELGHAEVAQLLQQTLDEERRTDQMLTQIAETRLNAAADGNGGTYSGARATTVDA